MSRSLYETPNEVLETARELGFGKSDICMVPGWQAVEIVDRFVERFAQNGKRWGYPYWIWEKLVEPRFGLPWSEDLKPLRELGSPEMPIWLIVEDNSNNKEGAPFWLFETMLPVATETLMNHYYIEFYICSKDFSWMIGQNHHDFLFASGDHAIAFLEALQKETEAV